ncbi:hypothetical protein WJX72_005041 [[Myrmecia] bisecta]|uniref:Uncharacterized protein n=1 Tax=[Myrmecia] bisecta TaxID=41462 RepID=A0AAW1QQI9_9CHLO
MPPLILRIGPLVGPAPRRMSRRGPARPERRSRLLLAMLLISAVSANASGESTDVSVAYRRALLATAVGVIGAASDTADLPPISPQLKPASIAGNNLQLACTSAVSLLRKYLSAPTDDALLLLEEAGDGVLAQINGTTRIAARLQEKGHCQVSVALNGLTSIAISAHKYIVTKDGNPAIAIVSKLERNTLAFRQTLATDAPCTVAGPGSMRVTRFTSQIVQSGVAVGHVHGAMASKAPSAPAINAALDTLTNTTNEVQATVDVFKYATDADVKNIYKTGQEVVNMGLCAKLLAQIFVQVGLQSHSAEVNKVGASQEQLARAATQTLQPPFAKLSDVSDVVPPPPARRLLQTGKPSQRQRPIEIAGDEDWPANVTAVIANTLFTSYFTPRELTFQVPLPAANLTSIFTGDPSKPSNAEDIQPPNGYRDVPLNLTIGQIFPPSSFILSDINVTEAVIEQYKFPGNGSLPEELLLASLNITQLPLYNDGSDPCGDGSCARLTSPDATPSATPASATPSPTVKSGSPIASATPSATGSPTPVPTGTSPVQTPANTPGSASFPTPAGTPQVGQRVEDVKQWKE